LADPGFDLQVQVIYFHLKSQKMNPPNLLHTKVNRSGQWISFSCNVAERQTNVLCNVQVQCTGDVSPVADLL